jgi:exodeoxyribonuclease V alpha subunit
MKVLKLLEEWKEKEFITSAEVEFVRFLQQMHPDVEEGVLMAAAVCIHAQSNGHVCLDIGTLDNGYLFNEPETGFKINDELKREWIAALRKSELVSSGGEMQPLVLEEERLYLHRFWKYEEELADWMKAKSANVQEITEDAKKALQLLLAPSKDLFETNWQQLAVVLSFLKDLIIISGGPGTGKTYTVLNIIAAQMLAHHGDRFRIALAAPTGKAARRLVDSIKDGKKNLSGQVSSQLEITEEALTVHKLLGADFQGSSFKFNEQNKLPYDMIVIDEASMLDLTMWVRLIRAVRPNTKLVVLGDKDQLASVEAGSILGDICGGENTFSSEISALVANITGMQIPSTQTTASINDCVIFLTKSYRFGENSGIQKLAKAINESDVEAAMEVLQDPNYEDVKWVKPTPEEIEKIVNEYAVDHHTWYSGKSIEERLSASHQKKILCALRRSKQGIEELNRIAEKKIRRKIGVLSSQEWYPGRIIMATRNNNILKVRNGEIGIFQPEETRYIEFESTEMNKIPIKRLADYEAAYAITIHKSQGSEFNDVAILLSNEENPLLSKEILYTSVTRARESTLICASEDIIRKTIQKNVWRKSGLKGKI